MKVEKEKVVEWLCDEIWLFDCEEKTIELLKKAFNKLNVEELNQLRLLVKDIKGA